MTQKGRILVIDDEIIALENLEHVLKKEGYDVALAQNGDEGLEKIAGQPFDVVLTDLKMSGMDGFEVLKKCRKLSPETEVIMITGYATLETAVKAMKHGAFHYIAKPFRMDEVRKVVGEALTKIWLKRENSQLKEQIESFQGKVRIVTQDTKMLRLLNVASQVAPANCIVLITGESGTGKELFARYVHYKSKSLETPFIAVNCGSFSEELLANELFGHEKGAFTGASSLKKGLIEAADSGTMFLDEITEMSSTMQAKLLRVIQEQEVLRLGSVKPVKVNVRFIAATNRALLDAVDSGEFRKDLYFRLKVVTLDIPPLCQRKDDIPLLAYHFLKLYSARMGKSVTEISREAMDILNGYEFPGNVRELKNIIERGVALVTGQTLEVSDLPDDLREMTVRTFRKKDGQIPTLREQEKEYILWVLSETNGNQRQAARLLGIDKVSLWRKLKKYNLE